MWKRSILRRLLDLVAMGTVADMGAQVQGENRILVRYGLQELRQARRMGVAQLAAVCDLEMGRVTAGDIASKLAPRLNSLGRVADPQKGVELLLQRESGPAELLAKELDLHNVQRQRLEQQMSEQVMKTLETQPELLKDKAIVMASSKWHPGVVPIVAARVAKRYHRPALMICIQRGVGKGSMRTISKFPLLPTHSTAMASFCSIMAAMTMRRVFRLRRRIFRSLPNGSLRRPTRPLTDLDVVPKLGLDAQANFSHLTFDLMDSLELLEPFGNGNSQPIFYCNARQAQPSQSGRAAPPQVLSRTGGSLARRNWLWDGHRGRPPGCAKISGWR